MEITPAPALTPVFRAPVASESAGYAVLAILGRDYGASLRYRADGTTRVVHSTSEGRDAHLCDLVRELYG